MDESGRLKLVGQRIKEIRKSKGMTQADLAKAANMAASNVSELENGKTQIQLLTLINIIEGLQASADDILRPNVPSVRSLYQGEYDEILSDCTPQEMEAIIKIARELKETLRSKREK